MIKKEKEFSALEIAVMNALLKGDEPVLDILKSQFSYASLKKRDLTGVGFFTHFKLPVGIKKLDPKISFKLGDVEADINGLKNGAGFLLYVENGVIDLLEGYCYDEEWPKKIKKFRIFYSSGEMRDLNAIRKKWNFK